MQLGQPNKEAIWGIKLKRVSELAKTKKRRGQVLAPLTKPNMVGRIVFEKLRKPHWLRKCRR